MPATKAPVYRSQGWIIGILLAGFVLACIRFALVQDIWIDESTQLSGARLPVADLVHWLAGTDVNRFGVPGDRMPPLAYLLDHAWWVAAGNALTPFRLFHILLATCGVFIIARTEASLLGRAWIGVGLAFLVLSPKLIEASGELRAYPLFFAMTCALVALFLDILKDKTRPPAWGKLLLFGGGCILLSYVHFFGVVAAFSFFATLVLAFVTDRVGLVRVLAVGTALGLSLVGLYPFIFGATTVSTAGATASSGDVEHYLPLLFGHPALLIYPIAALLYFAACALLIAAAIYGAARRAVQRRSQPADWLLVVAIIGCAATIAPSFLISTFSALKPSYSVWLLPVFALILASGASQAIGWGAWDRYLRLGAVAALLVGAATATGVFLAEAPWFVHGPHRIIETARELSPPASAIVYAEPETYAYGYFPMVYEGQGHLPQWLAVPGGVSRLPADTAAPVLPLSALAPYRGLVVVAIHGRHYTDLRDCLHGLCPDFPTPPLVDALVNSGRWSIAARTRAFGFYDALVIRLTAKPLN